MVVLDLKSEIAGTPLPMEIASRDSDFSKAVIADADPSIPHQHRSAVDENVLWSHSTVIMAILLRA